MGTTPEGKIKQKIKALLTRHKVYYFMPVGWQFGRQGIPDIICCIGGRMVAIEVKADGGKVSPAQEMEIARINKCGGLAFVAQGMEGIEKVEALLEGLT